MRRPRVKSRPTRLVSIRSVLAVANLVTFLVIASPSARNAASVHALAHMAVHAWSSRRNQCRCRSRMRWDTMCQKIFVHTLSMRMKSVMGAQHRRQHLLRHQLLPHHRIRHLRQSPMCNAHHHPIIQHHPILGNCSINLKRKPSKPSSMISILQSVSIPCVATSGYRETVP